MRIIFLDIDGVVCTQRSLYRAYARWLGIPPESLSTEYRSMDEKIRVELEKRQDKKEFIPHFSIKSWPFDEEAVNLLHKIVRENPDINFVISSTWRICESVDSLTEKFDLKGLCIPILGFTDPPKRGSNRGEEIQTWLKNHKKEHNVTNFCVLDDEVSSGISSLQPDNHVKTSFTLGFTKAEYEGLMSILGR